MGTTVQVPKVEKRGLSRAILGLRLDQQLWLNVLLGKNRKWLFDLKSTYLLRQNSLKHLN